MSYINRFTFKRSIGFRLLERGFNYLTKISSISIDGNLVHATIEGTKPYSVDCLIDFENRKLLFPSCTCPYIEEHRYCKHEAALLLYLDIYINGGSVYELENFYIAEAIVNVLNDYDRLNIFPSRNNLLNSLINKPTHSFLKNDHIYLISDALSKIEEKRFDEAMRFLLRNKIIKQSKDRIILLKNSIHTSYYYFFAKYSLLIGEENDEYEDDYDELYEREYYYSKQIEEKHNGININYLSHLLKESNQCYLYLDLENKTILHEFDLEEYSNFDKENNIIPKVKLSNDFMAFMINTIEDETIRNNLMDGLEETKINSSNFLEKIPDNPKNQIAIDNYYTGKLLEICLLGNIWIDFPIPYNLKDDDFRY